jgi:hypothetical protein
MPHPDSTRDLGRDDTFFKQVGRLHATLFHAFEVTPRSTSSEPRPYYLLYRK